MHTRPRHLLRLVDTAQAALQKLLTTTPITLRRARNAAEAGLAVAVAYWDTGTRGEQAGPDPDPDPDPHTLLPAALVYADDQILGHHTGDPVLSTLCGPFGHITGDAAALEHLGDQALLLATATRLRLERPVTERPDQP
ncbi:hypothetical protein ABTX81_30350 [Kitasatospora sp. NPDC097605]|uniref:hypothetical protein n=1 Tax=Kitasatospora sp. NPDC097605 TaxID=3157226 RepID=UPI00332DE212